MSSVVTGVTRGEDARLPATMQMTTISTQQPSNIDMLTHNAIASVDIPFFSSSAAVGMAVVNSVAIEAETMAGAGALADGAGAFDTTSDGGSTPGVEGAGAGLRA